MIPLKTAGKKYGVRMSVSAAGCYISQLLTEISVFFLAEGGK